MVLWKILKGTEFEEQVGSATAKLNSQLCMGNCAQADILTSPDKTVWELLRSEVDSEKTISIISAWHQEFGGNHLKQFIFLSE